jgi:hypothetical protein
MSRAWGRCPHNNTRLHGITPANALRTSAPRAPVSVL